MNHFKIYNQKIKIICNKKERLFSYSQNEKYLQLKGGKKK